MANLLVNYRLSKIWFGISFVSVMVFAFFHMQLPAVEHPDETPLYIASVTGLCLILFLFTSLFDRARYKILRLLKVRNEDLVSKQKQITEINLKLEDKIDEIDRKNRRLEKHWNTLIDISKHKHINFGTLEEALNHIAQVTARSIDVGRVSVWLYHDASEVSERIECVSAYDLHQDRYFKNEELTREANPRYFKALKMERVVVAEDAQHHPDTEAFTKNYLAVHDIRSMLDAPFFMDGKLAGVICCENQGSIKSWKPEDIIFAASMAEIVSLAFRSAARRTYEKQLRILSKEIKQQNELLTRKSQEVTEANESLERRVLERTEQLMEKNRQLAEYAFINSHMLRALCAGYWVW
ncbi:MAG: GAF domain-containing protein [Bacteroidia bacterium]|nr:GAF domain-containing protein [Bacteroidia bacterium]